MIENAQINNNKRNGDIWPYFYTTFFIIILIWLTGIWVWPNAAEIEGLNSEKPGGFIINVCSYLILIVHFAVVCIFRPMPSVIQSIAPIVPFLLYALLCALFGIDPLISLRLLSLWFLPVICGIIFSQLYTFESLLVATSRFLIASCALSIIYQILSPQAASIQGYLRGLYTGKNVMGFIAAVAIIVIFASRRHISIASSVCGIALSTICLVLSGSRTSFLACLVSCAVHTTVTLKVSRTMRVSIICGLIAVMIIMTTFGFDFILELLGKDPTLTGRTLIWDLYISEALLRPIFGAGPATFTGVTPITEPYREAFKSLGDIQSPHNFFIVIAGEVGLPGLVLLVFFLSRQITHALKNPSPQNALAASVAAFIMVEGMGESMGGFSQNILWMLLAIAQRSDPIGQKALSAKLSLFRTPRAILSKLPLPS